jgi:serine/threonine-protein kinase
VIGQLLNQYRIEEVVGQGGMGVVYRALDVNLERTVAMKVLSASFRDDPEFIERFRQEVRIQAGLNHPNIATLYDFFVWDGLPVAVMEFIKGETLRSMIDRCGPIPAHIALPIFVQALRGVAAGHKRHIIHRDLKPSNLMITDEGIVKVTDFGIAKVRSLTGLTQASTRVGSTSYMAPEQILGRPVDVQTDIYIMGGTLYELLCGRPPFQGISQFEIDSAHVRDLPTPPTAYCPNIPPAAVAAVMRALAKEPSARFATAEDFIQALPDLHGVPYIALSPPTDDDATRQPRNIPNVAPVPRTVLASSDETRQPQSAPNVVPIPRRGTASPHEMPPHQDAPKAARSRHVTTTIAVGGLLVLSVAGTVLYLARQADVSPERAPRPHSTPAEQPAPSPPPSQKAHRDLSGMWTGTYLDRSGRALLQLQNLQMQQVPDGAITGHFTYKAGSSAGEECTLDKSTYSTQSKHLRLIVHCHNPNHPKYLNVPLEFIDVDPDATSIEGGRLAFHLADDIVVTLKRAKGI